MALVVKVSALHNLVSTTGTSIASYMTWLNRELSSKEYGEVSITFKIHRGQITDVRRESVETEHIPLNKQ